MFMGARIAPQSSKFQMKVKREKFQAIFSKGTLRKRDQCFCNFSTMQVEIAKRRQNFFELQPTFILVRKTKDRHLYFRQRGVSLNET